ncbi:MAG TPA: hypothetical protein VGM92_03075, partial [Candidatus Kapabacteria bacterium]
MRISFNGFHPPSFIHAIFKSLLISLVLIITTGASAQWKNVLSLGWENRVTVIYFLDQLGYKNIGFACTDKDIFKTMDTGTTWVRVSTSNYPSELRDI